MNGNWPWALIITGAALTLAVAARDRRARKREERREAAREIAYIRQVRRVVAEAEDITRTAAARGDVP